MKIPKWIAWIIYYGYTAIQYFKRETEVRIQYISDEGKKEKDSFTISVTQWRKCWELTGIDWVSVHAVLSVLKTAKNKARLEMSHGYGAREYIVIPKWAKKPLIKQLEKEIAS
jgi:hypothetical protein